MKSNWMKTYYYSIDDNQIRTWETLKSKTLDWAKSRISRITNEHGNVNVRLGYRDGDYIIVTHKRCAGYWSELTHKDRILF